MLGWAAAATLLAFTAILGAAALRLSAVTSILLAAYVLAAAEIILLTEVLSLFHAVGAAGYAAGQLFLLGAALVLWTRRGRPLPPLPRIRARALTEHPTLVLLAGVFAFALAYQAFLVLATTPNTWDSLAYHLARAAEWYQRGSVDYYPTHSESVNAPQPNSEMLILFGLAFAHRDTFAAVPQLLAEIACVVAVFGIARRFGFTRPASGYAALLAATLPQVTLQAVTTQNDLLTASFLAAALYFVLGRNHVDLALAGLSVGLALGTKATAVLALPLLLLAAALVRDRQGVFRGAAYAAAGFTLVGAYGYVLNVVHTQRPLGDPHALGPLPRKELTLSGTASTVSRIGFNFLDLSGYPLPDSAMRPVELAGRELFRIARIPANPPDATVLEPPVPSPFKFKVNTETHEARSYFGPLGAVLLLPLTAASLLAVAVRRAPAQLLVPALAIPLFVLGIALSTRYNDYNGRYLLPAVILAMPLSALLYQRRVLATLAAGVGALTLTMVHMHNELKPSGATAQPPIWTIGRADAQALTWKAKAGEIADVIEAVERHVPADGRLGYVLRYNDLIYPFYGRDLRRRLVLLPRMDVLAAADRASVDAIVISGSLRESPPEWRAIRFRGPGSGSTLVLRRGHSRDRHFSPAARDLAKGVAHLAERDVVARRLHDEGPGSRARALRTRTAP